MTIFAPIGNEGIQVAANRKDFMQRLNEATTAGKGLTGLLSNALTLKNRYAVNPNMVAAQKAQLDNQAAMNNAQAPLQGALQKALLGQQQEKVPFMQAQAARTNQLTKLLPEQLSIARANAIAKAGALQNSSNRFSSPLYTLAKWLQSAPEPVRSKFISKNPGIWTQITQQGLNRINANNAPSQNVSNKILEALGVNADNNQKPVNNPLTLDSNTAKSIANAANNDYLNKTTPPNIKTQRYYANTAKNLYDQTNKLVPSVSSFSGAAGTLNNLGNAVRSTLGGEASPDYLNLLKFKQNVVLLGNELRRAMGSQATDKELKILKSVTAPSLATKTPSQTLELYRNLGDLLKTVSTSITPDQATIKNKISDNNVATGNSGGGELKIPTFSNKNQFLTWYKSQPDSVKKRVRKQIGN